MALPIYNYNNFEGRETITVLVGGEQLIADDTHPRFKDIVNKLLVEKDDTADWVAMFSPAIGIKEEFAKLSTQVSIRGGQIFYEGEQVHGALADKIVNIYQAGETYAPFVLFLEKLKKNPEPHSVDNLYRWLQADPEGFAIADDGDLIVYKGVKSNFKSHWAGNAIRNGEQLFNSQIPNVPGDIIEMDRKDVEHDPATPCAPGLHVGTWEFVRGYAVILKVKLNPEYVVSVPNDHRGQKMRVCRYQVIEQVTERVTSEYEYGWKDAKEDAEAFEEAFQVHNIGGEEVIDATFRPETKTSVDFEEALKEIRDPNGTLGWSPQSTVEPASNQGTARDTRLNYQTQRRGPDGRFLPKPSPQPW